MICEVESLDSSARGLLDYSVEPLKLTSEVDGDGDERAQVLVIDDNSMNLEAIGLLLIQLNIKSDNAISGEIAIDLVVSRIKNRQEMYKLILCDFSMPTMDGPTTTRKIRSFIVMANEECMLMSQN